MSEFPAPRGQPEPRAWARGVAFRAPEAAPSLALPVELAAFEGRIDPALLETALHRADALGVGGDEVVRCHRLATPEAVAIALAAALDLEIDPLEGVAELDSARCLQAASTGVLVRTLGDGRRVLTLAPRGLAVRRLAAALAQRPELREHLRLASPEALARHVRAASERALAEAAVEGLKRRHPDLSAATRRSPLLRSLGVLLAIAAPVAAIALADPSLVATEFALAALFLAWTGLRLRACIARPAPAPAAGLAEADLPVYTVVVPLYREAHMVPPLVAALRRLDYPPEKLDIKLVTEADDADTRAAVAGLDLPAPFEEIVAPREGPRTKPKALAAALPFARGSLVVVFDAEDEPEPGQLRAAAGVFASGPPELACVQARLAIHNADDTWFSRQFAAEYAGLFDVFLPALAARGLPLPLGGTSNHFRIDALRRVGGWDPFNVTEDADLGMRLARFGYRTAVADATTWEEAPVRARQWLRQRTRWFKGWMQTWLVHMRAPLRLARELGGRGFAAFQLLVGGTVLAALVHPFFLWLLASDALAGKPAPGGPPGEDVRMGVALAVLAAGYLGSALLGAVGFARRGRKGIAWVVVTMPLYWLLLSVAAWRALWQFATDPHGWEKTEHGLARPRPDPAKVRRAELVAVIARRRGA